MDNEKKVLRELAKEYSEHALHPKCAERLKRYCALNDLQQVRPPVLVFEEPFGEIMSEELTLRCVTPYLREIEWQLRESLYKFRHYEGDYAVHPYFGVKIPLVSSGIGVQVSQDVREFGSGTNIQSHNYHDVLSDEKDLDKVHTPDISIDENELEYRMDIAEDIFHGILPVRKQGHDLCYSMWDEIATLHGMNELLMDFYDRPDFLHKIVRKFTDICISIIDQYEKLNVLSTDAVYLHCTPASVSDMRYKDPDKEKITAKDTWLRVSAQPFNMVSPDMLEEFDITYLLKYCERARYVYYGCCEPLHDRIDKISKIPNLRRISISPWADIKTATEKIRDNYVMSVKSHPGLVAQTLFCKAEVEKHIRDTLNICMETKTPVEFILKDISTVCKDASRLTRFVEVAERTIDEFFPREKY